VQVCGHPLAFIFQDGDLGHYTFPLQLYIPAVIQDNRHHKKYNDDGYQQGDENSRIEYFVDHGV
jgi:hypothetical protein